MTYFRNCIHSSYIVAHYSLHYEGARRMTGIGFCDQVNELRGLSEYIEIEIANLL